MRDWKNSVWRQLDQAATVESGRRSQQRFDFRSGHPGLDTVEVLLR
jgi:hypothetical protein